MSYTRNSLQSSKHTQTESERIEKKTFYANINAKKPEVATLVSDKIDFKKKKTTTAKDEKGHTNGKEVNSRRGCKFMNINTPIKNT